MRVADGGGHQHRARLLQQPGIRWQTQLAVDHHPQGLALGNPGGMGQRQFIGPHGQGGIVRQHRANTSQNGTAARPPLLHIGPGLGAGNPLAFTAGHGGAAIQTHGLLQPQQRALLFHPQTEARIERPGARRQHIAGDLNPRRLQFPDAAAGNLGIRVDHGHHYPGHAGRIRAWAQGGVRPR